MLQKFIERAQGEGETIVSKMVNKLFQEEHDCNNEEVEDYNEKEENVVMEFSDIEREGDDIEYCSLVQDSKKNKACIESTHQSFQELIDLEAGHQLQPQLMHLIVKEMRMITPY
eukprot:6713094-Ditylum_brightwellii.AAC.2